MTELKCGDWVWAWDDDKSSGVKALYLAKSGVAAKYYFVWLTTVQHNAHMEHCEPYADQDKPKKRLMTRDEVLHFVATTSGIVARVITGETYPAQQLNYAESQIASYEWSYSSPTGEYEWNKFETEEA